MQHDCRIHHHQRCEFPLEHLLDPHRVGGRAVPRRHHEVGRSGHADDLPHRRLGPQPRNAARHLRHRHLAPPLHDHRQANRALRHVAAERHGARSDEGGELAPGCRQGASGDASQVGRAAPPVLGKSLGQVQVGLRPRVDGGRAVIALPLPRGPRLPAEPGDRAGVEPSDAPLVGPEVELPHQVRPHPGQALQPGQVVEKHLGEVALGPARERRHHAVLPRGDLDRDGHRLRGQLAGERHHPARPTCEFDDRQAIAMHAVHRRIRHHPGQPLRPQPRPPLGQGDRPFTERVGQLPPRRARTQLQRVDERKIFLIEVGHSGYIPGSSAGDRSL